MAVLAALGYARAALAGTYVVLSLASFVLYGVDKAAAVRGRRRIPETGLHLIALAGGWPGAFVGQRAFRHKTKKRSFRAVFWCTVVANSVAAVWLMVSLPRVTG